MRLNEIEKLSKSFYTGEEDLEDFDFETVKHDFKNVKKISNNLYWKFSKDYTPIIKLYTPKFKYPGRSWNDVDERNGGPVIGPAVIGFLTFDDYSFTISGKKTFNVNTIAVRKEFQGKGYGKLLYLLALKRLGVMLISGDSQTPAGRAAWVGLSNTPGVEVNGCIIINCEALDPLDWDDSTDKLVTDLMSAGFNYIGKSRDNHFFTFPVTADKKPTKSWY